ncbi:hypothetical protein C3747_71g102 [Trypanosoma cruzi]|uniref:Uncharacterized protein n=2 Tax=Trypanosoma cruzi TaxID=5693 RepID=Q4CN41_TRYCC|nr:hypothetical protein, conserved [Trypanosoma cruzi]EAN81691.1 hypothetical protein, conserved [Trypanosoma cruzi]PWV10241.1 hypothetical protein C3747_71g102 [Trypanosoma cruzi]RNC49862.1 hypothetical protein TcCL_NonESM00185 [Trypanosoma cruzi]|eukprot:XP_803137.1 hypothetical protein [Trypanosoma cruzi strain CL Brener]
MELEVASDGDVYARSLQEARWDILQGLNVAKDWGRLEERHPFFRDVILDAKRQAKLLASVLTATEFFLQRLLWCCENDTAPSFVDANRVKQWRASLAVFISLYESSPVPTRARWLAESRERADGTCAVSVDGDEKYNSYDHNKVRGMDDDDVDDDDGSFVENRLKDMVLQCLAIGRMWCRQLDEEDEMAVKVRHALSVMDAFAAPKTFDW